MLVCSLQWFSGIRPGHTTRENTAFFCNFDVLRCIANHHRCPQRYGQSATHNGMFSYHPTVFNDAMAIMNIYGELAIDMTTFLCQEQTDGVCEVLKRHLQWSVMLLKASSLPQNALM